MVDLLVGVQSKIMFTVIHNADLFCQSEAESMHLMMFHVLYGRGARGKAHSHSAHSSQRFPHETKRMAIVSTTKRHKKNYCIQTASILQCVCVCSPCRGCPSGQRSSWPFLCRQLYLPVSQSNMQSFHAKELFLIFEDSLGERKPLFDLLCVVLNDKKQNELLGKHSASKSDLFPAKAIKVSFAANLEHMWAQCSCFIC